MSKQKSGLGSGLPKNANDAEQSAQVELYNVTLAESAEQREREMTFGEALKADRRLIMYSIGFSGTIIMEGYGLALMTYLFTLEPFNRKYGVLTADGKYEVRVACFLGEAPVVWPMWCVLMCCFVSRLNIFGRFFCRSRRRLAPSSGSLLQRRVPNGSVTSGRHS